MRKQLLTLALAVAAMTAAAQTGYHSEVWDPDNGNGTYTNPVLNADYSDPDAIAVGDDYYLTASSFNCIPGLPILHSKDLVNWQIIGHALPELTPREVFDQPQHGRGVWAPCIRYHDGQFYIYWGDPDYGVFMVKADRPDGEWSKPVCVVPGKGMIDPSPLWDDDGRCYLVNAWAGSRAGFNSVLTVRELSADGTKAIGQPRIVFDGGQENHTSEGPKFYKRDGWYWIMCPAGGVQHGWQLAMRSRSPYGPYERKRVMAQGKSKVNGPHQGAWIHTAFGEDWFLHFNDRYAYGRVVFLQPVTWRDNWPVMGIDKDGDYCGEPVMTYRKPRSASKVRCNPQESDEFTDGLGLQWQWHANYDQTYGMPLTGGWYRLYNVREPEGYKSMWQLPNLLLQKTPAQRFTVTTKVRVAAKQPGEYGGLLMMGMNYTALVVCREGDAFELQLRSCKDADKGNAETVTKVATLQPTECDTIKASPAIYASLYLRMTVNDGNYRFSYSLDNRHFTAVPGTFVMRQGKWIGAKVGFVSACRNAGGNKGWMDVDWFRVTK